MVIENILTSQHCWRHDKAMVWGVREGLYTICWEDTFLEDCDISSQASLMINSHGNISPRIISFASKVFEKCDNLSNVPHSTVSTSQKEDHK